MSITEELILKFRQWNLDWMGFNAELPHYKKPKSIEDFAKELEEDYVITKRDRG